MYLPCIEKNVTCSQVFIWLLCVIFLSLIPIWEIFKNINLTYFPFAASKMLNPIALFRSASLRTSSSRILVNSSYTTDEDFEGTDDPSEEDCLFSAGHQSTLDKLYAWEKKLYEEVRVYYWIFHLLLNMYPWTIIKPIFIVKLFQ